MPLEKGDIYPICNECKRLHLPEEPCSQRVANALMMQPQALEHLTKADKDWMSTHEFSILELVESTVAEMMQCGD